MKQKKNTLKAFTLIEVIAVMSIMSLLATVIVPKINRYINQANKTKLISAVSELNNYIVSKEIEQNNNFNDISSILNSYGKLSNIEVDSSGQFKIGKLKGNFKYENGVITAILNEPTEFANQEIGTNMVN